MDKPYIALRKNATAQHESLYELFDPETNKGYWIQRKGNTLILRSVKDYN